ncbi:MAG: hypothetical protein AB7G88_14280 [Thermomicrobiales bacterium]
MQISLLAAAVEGVVAANDTLLRTAPAESAVNRGVLGSGDRVSLTGDPEAGGGRWNLLMA